VRPTKKPATPRAQPWCGPVCCSRVSRAGPPPGHMQLAMHCLWVEHHQIVGSSKHGSTNNKGLGTWASSSSARYKSSFDVHTNLFAECSLRVRMPSSLVSEIAHGVQDAKLEGALKAPLVPFTRQSTGARVGWWCRRGRLSRVLTCLTEAASLTQHHTSSCLSSPN